MYIWTLLGTSIVAVLTWLLLSGFVRTWRLYRGTRVIVCPETHRHAAVAVDATSAAKWYAIAGETDIHLRSCSRWPEKADCDQACLRQVQTEPEACRVQNLVTKWYAGKSCHYCARTIGEIVWHERPPAVRLPDGTMREWKHIAPEALPDTFAHAEAVCWACHVVETFRREHPSRVIERNHLAETHHALPPSQSVY